MTGRRIVGLATLCFIACASSGHTRAATDGNDKASEKTDWPGFLGLERNSKSSETNILKDWSNGKLKIKWQTDVGWGYSMCSVAEGRLFQFDAIGKKSRLRCLEARSGKLIWEYSYDFEYQDTYGFDNGPRASPIVDGNRVYIHGVAGRLSCLDVETGRLVWQVECNEQFGVVQNFFGVGSSPAILNDYLVVMIGGSPPKDQKSPRLDTIGPNGTAIVVFDKNDGTIIHRFGNDLASYSSIQFYREGSKTRGLAWLRNNLMGFDIENGTVLWKTPYRARKYESVNATTPVVSGDKIFISESYGPGSALFQLENGQPKIVWNDNNPRQRSLATHWNTPVLHEGFLYASHGENTNGAEIRCVELSTGQVQWKKRGFGRSSLTFIDGHLIVMDERGKLVLIQASPKAFNQVTEYTDPDGRMLPVQYPCWSAPVISDGLLFVRGKRRLIGLELKPK